jgi:Uncharacterized small protein (DUF2292)
MTELSTITRLALFAKSVRGARSVALGSVEIVIQDSRIAHMERKEKIRFDGSYGSCFQIVPTGLPEASWHPPELTRPRRFLNEGGYMRHFNWHPSALPNPLGKGCFGFRNQQLA